MTRTIDTTATRTINRTDNFERLMADIRKTPMLTADEEIELFTAYKNEADEAVKTEIRNRIVSANLRFVVSVAKKYSSDAGMVADLVSVGTIGMSEAVDGFDLSAGFKFISFAVHKIRAEFSEYFRLNGTIVRRTNNSVIGSKDIKVSERLYQELQREPSEDEIMDALRDEYGIEFRSRYDVLRVKAEYLSDTYGEDGTVEDNSEVAVVTASVNDYEREIEDEDAKAKTEKLLSVLTVAERDVVRRVLGIGMDRAQEFDEIGEEIGYTGERVRQIYKGAIKRMRASAKRVLAM